MLPETSFILYGISNQPYPFTVYPISDELPSNFAGLYVYVSYIGNERKLIYGGKSINIPARHNQHKKDFKIINKATHIGVHYSIDFNNLEKAEADLIEGNKFELNIQHNQ